VHSSFRGLEYCAVYFESGYFETGIAYLNLGHGASSCGAGCPQVALAVFWNNIIEKIWLWEYLNRALCMINSLSVLRFGDTLQRCIFNFSFRLFYTACFPTCKKYESFSGIVGIQNIPPGIQIVMIALLAGNNGNYRFPRFSSVVWRLCMSLGQIYVLHGV
jgi:hypothetical protein